MFAVNKSILFAAIAALSCAAFATPVVYTGYTGNTNNAVFGSAAASRLAMVQFMDATVQTYDFESARPGDTAANVNPLTFTGGTAPINASIAGDGVVTSGAILGRFNTTQASPKNPGLTGANGNYWQARAGVAGSGNVAGIFSISFNRGISALGFYVTDIGDFEGLLTMTLTSTDGSPDVSYTPPLGAVGNANNNDLLYWGFYDLTTTYSKITFTTSGASATADFFGFDDLFVADKSQIVTATVPEPSTIALVGLALAGIGLSARKRKTA